MRRRRIRRTRRGSLPWPVPVSRIRRDVGAVAEHGAHVGGGGAVEEQGASVVVGRLPEHTATLGAQRPTVHGSIRFGHEVVGFVQVLPHVLADADGLRALQGVEVRTRSVDETHDGLVKRAGDGSRTLRDHLVVESAEVSAELVGERHDDRDGVRQHVLLAEGDGALRLLRTLIDPCGLRVADDDRHASTVAGQFHLRHELHERALVFCGLQDLRLGFRGEV